MEEEHSEKAGNERVIRHLEMTQAVITRMAHNSFLIKGWAVVLLVASFWISARVGGGVLERLVICFSIGALWFLDGFYLRQEMLYRCLYDDIRGKSDTDFSMDARRFSGAVPV